MLRSLTLLAALLLPASSLVAQEPTVPAGPRAAAPAEVLILGTYHFANPGLDVVKNEVADVLTADRQAEIAAVVEALARFRPTRVAVEGEPEDAAVLDERYRAYLAGERELSRNEIEQLGFRLAARFEHPRVWPIDHSGRFPYQELMTYAEEHDPGFVAWFQEEIVRITEEMNRQQREETIGDILRLLNHPDQLARGHGLYMRQSEVGAGDTFVGARLVSDWYERNIHIFANLQRLAEPGDRILLIIGAGHAPILRELVAADPRLELVDPLEYLPEG